MTAAGIVLLAYLVGSLPTGLFVVRLLRGEDIREHGSGNVGAANVFRVAGLPVALLVLALDMAKGAFPVLLARSWGASIPVTALAGLAAIAGHNWSVFLRFGGGKGIATSFGVLLALSPWAAAAAALVWAVVVALTRYASLGSLLGMAAVPPVMGARGEPAAHLGFAALALLFAVYKHRGNIVRLRLGTELRITGRRGGATDRPAGRA
ncbi:MAG TPA: glycerol-3-phosphate 1-O-acyltransferase PlsY [bacterium]|nr:glycerol-3-phosphate 1-O-acyltransferase PlsY [Gemmatimonadales bacterium]HEU5300588.1 glycerol-3-phosphate 1-O-acyltransferase PlsY [bacterium]